MRDEKLAMFLCVFRYCIEIIRIIFYLLYSIKKLDAFIFFSQNHDNFPKAFEFDIQQINVYLQ